MQEVKWKQMVTQTPPITKHVSVPIQTLPYCIIDIVYIRRVRAGQCTTAPPNLYYGEWDMPWGISHSTSKGMKYAINVMELFYYRPVSVPPSGIYRFWISTICSHCKTFIANRLPKLINHQNNIISSAIDCSVLELVYSRLGLYYEQYLPFS